MQFLKTLESSSRFALEYLYITVKLAVTLKSRTNRQLSGSSPHDMSCPSKGITLCQSLKGTLGEFLCNTNTRALHSKVILTHAISWPKSYNANSTLLTMIYYASAHVWGRKAYNAS